MDKRLAVAAMELPLGQQGRLELQAQLPVALPLSTRSIRVVLVVLVALEAAPIH
jgi:hypothetical protein